MRMKHILIVDDESKLRGLLARIIRLEGYDVAEAGDCQTARKKLAQAEINLVLCDVKLPDGNGLEFTREIRAQYPHVEVILMTAFGQIADGVQAIKDGAFDYLAKGDDNNRILPLIARAFEKIDLAQRVADLEQQIGDQHSFDRIIGRSSMLHAVLALARRVADSDATVLLTGETGTGKEVFAQAIHSGGKRRSRRFVAVNCAAFSRDLLESELFGHRAGAFTGAVRDQRGLLQEANGGTLFLDEIGDMPADLQVKLLRVLESGEYFRIGDTRPTTVDARIIAATHKDLRAEIAAGRFRDDLYYRISVFTLHLPALRDRPEDIDDLARHFIRVYARQANKRVTDLSPEALSILRAYTWPGNIRELKNVIERAVILSTTETLTPDLLAVELSTPFAEGPEPTANTLSLASAEKAHIQKVLRLTGGNKTKAAERLGIALTTLYRKIEEYGIS